jgi:hypothetical protein
MSALLAFRNFDRAHYHNLVEFLLLHEVLPLILVTFSYGLLIKGNIVPLNAEFIHPLISIDGITYTCRRVFLCLACGPLHWRKFTALVWT